MIFFGRRYQDEAEDGTGGGSGGGNGAAAPADGAAASAEEGAAAAKPAGDGAASESGAQKSSADQVKGGMLDAINKMLDAPADGEKPAVDASAKPAASADAGAKGEQAVTAADARKYLVGKGQAKELAGKSDADILKLYETAKAAEKPAGDKKPTDAELFKVPEGLKKDGQARFQKLVEATKAERAEREKAEAAVKERDVTIGDMRNIFAETKTSAEDLSQLLEYNRRVKTGDLEGALKIIDEQRRQIAQQLGRPVDGVDLLEGFDDLKAELAEEKITPERAHEIAAARRAAAARQRDAQQRERTEQAEGQRKQVREKALSDIATFASKKSKEDVDYKKKEEILLAAVERITKKFPPQHWLAALEEAYDAITIASSTSAGAPAAGAPDPNKQPLRPNSGGGGVAKPSTMGAAIDQALGYSSGA